MIILKHFKNVLWLIESEKEVDEIMNSVGGEFTVYKDVTKDDISVLKKYGMITE